MASAISGFINTIQNAVYGEQVRSAIVSALEACYSDVESPSLNQAAFTAAINEAYAGGILDIQTVTSFTAMTNQKIIYRYNGTAAGKQKGLYYYSALSDSWVLIGSEIQKVSLLSQMTDANDIYKYVGTETGMVQNSLYCHNGTEWVPIGSGVLTAPTAASMTNQNAIYKYTGNESGYTANSLYYFNGTAFVPISEGVVCDHTLTQADFPADAKATGDRLTPLETIIFGGTGEVVATTYVKSRPSVLGLTDTSSTNDGRLISDYISGKVKITAVETINFLVVQYDMLGAFEGIIMPDGSLNNTTTVVPSTMYSQGEIIIPAGKQGRIMARKGTGNNIALTDADSILIYKATASITDMVTEQAISSLAYPNLYGKNLAALGDSLLEWSNKWVTQSATRFQMPTYIRGVGSQYWFCNSSRPNGAVYQVDNLVASDFVPDIVILEYGTNDVWSASGSFGTYETPAAQDATTSVGAMRYCIEKLQSTYPDCKILVILPMIRNNNGLEPTAQTTFRALAKQVLADYSVQWVDMYETSGIVYAMMNPDGIHLMKVEGGYRVEGTGLYKYADRVERALINL